MATTSPIRLRVDPPKVFTGKEPFDDFAKRLRAYMALSDPYIGTIIDAANKRAIEHPDLVITNQEVSHLALDDKGQQIPDYPTALDFIQKNAVLYYVLTGLLDGGPSNLCDTIDDSNGAEAFRRITTRYARARSHSALVILMRIISAKSPDDDNLETKVSVWENDILKFEKAIGKELYEEIKVGLLVGGTTGKLYDHLCLNLGTLKDYTSTRQIVVNYAKTKVMQSYKHNKHYNPSDPMDVDAIQKGGNYKGKKGKGKGQYKGNGGKQNYGTIDNYVTDNNYSSGKGKKSGGKSKGKGKTSGKSRYCSWCKTTTHNTSDCRSKKRVQGVDYEDYDHYNYDQPEPEDHSATPAPETTQQSDKKVNAAIHYRMDADDEDKNDYGVVGDETSDNTYYFDVGMIAKQTNYVNQISEPYNYYDKSDELMVDSGAQVCVCPLQYAPEIPLTKLSEEETPKLRTVTDKPIKVYGVKWIDYLLDDGHWMAMRFLVCDVTMCIVSEHGLSKCNYETRLGKNSTLWHQGTMVNNLHRRNGINYIVTTGRCEYRRQRRSLHHNGNTTKPTTTTTDIVAAIPTNDYWQIEGNRAIRVHVRPRLQKYIPTTKNTYPGTEKTTDPWLHRLGPSRTTKVVYQHTPDDQVGGKTKPIVITDSWASLETHEPLPHHWTGQTIFDYDPEESVKEKTNDVELTVADGDQLHHSVDHWTRDGTTWTRHHVVVRDRLFDPSSTTDGPDPQHLSDRRVTTMTTGTTTQQNTDDWRLRRNGKTDYFWKGTTVFEENALFPQLIMNDYVEEAHNARPMTTPKEPTKEERELHEITHLPFRDWCPLCVRCKGNGDYHRQVYDKKPVVQIDYAFITKRKGDDDTTEDDVKAVPVLTGVDVTTGMALAAVVPKKGPTDYACNELKRFLFEIGRTHAVLQADQEPAIQALARRVSAEVGIPLRKNPAYSS